MLIVRIIAIFAAMLAFGILLYALYGKSKDTMEDAANIPLMDDDIDDTN